jgi:hypothetical protein
MAPVDRRMEERRAIILALAREYQSAIYCVLDTTANQL